MVAVLFSFRNVIFQKGNPLPYIKGMLQLNNKPYVQIHEDNPIIFITKRDNYSELHKYIESYYGVSFDEQMGNGYFFRSKEKTVTVSSEIYWRYYIVWTVSIN
jgi:hypothetical protein